MLILSRQTDESVMIGDDIEVKVIEVRGGKIRLGFSVPKETPVHRREVYELIRRENERQAEQVK